MNAMAQLFIAITALIHLWAFVCESILFNRPGVHKKIFKVPTADLPAVRLWSFNVGFYNFALAAGLTAGLVLHHTGNVIAGQTLVLYLCSTIILLGIILFVSDRMELSRPKGSGVTGAVAQATPPLIALAAIAL